MKKLFSLMLILIGCTKEFKMEQPTDFTGQKPGTVAQARLDIPDQIRFTKQGLYPEGVAFDKLNNRFLVSSVTTGTIGAVTYTGIYKPFIQDTALHNTIGLEIDEARKQVLAVIGDVFGNVAQLGIYDLRTGSRIRIVDLAALRPGAIHLADDVAIDPQGNKYITDAKSPIVYKIDPDGHPFVLFENELYAEPPGFPFYWVGFNGIVYNRNGFLIVGFYTGGKLLKIPVNDPDNYSEIQLDVPLASPDGLLLSKDGKQLIVVDNRYLGDDAEIVFMVSDNKWASAKRIESFSTGLVSPTTATGNGKDVFVMYSYLQDIFFGSEFSQKEFTIQKIPFEKTKAF